jgi:cytochrome c-550 PedF
MKSTPNPVSLRSASRRGAAKASTLLLALCACVAAPLAWAHGDVTPQAVDTSALPKLGEQWRPENPFRGNEAAVKIGTSAYNQNCARCHGLDAISGGIAPDLRKLDGECATLKDAGRRAACVKEIDEFYSSTVRTGRTRNGAVYMPPFEGVMSQEAVWSIKAYLETRREKPF